MTKLQITIDRGPESNPAACGYCDRYYHEEAHGYGTVCPVFRRELELTDVDDPLRCPECLEAEVKHGQ